MSVKKVRLWTHVSPETDKQLAEWSQRLGINKAILLNLCIKAGMGNIIRTFAPEEVLEPKKMAALIKAMGKSGVVLPRGKAPVAAKRATR